MVRRFMQLFGSAVLVGALLASPASATEHLDDVATLLEAAGVDVEDLPAGVVEELHDMFEDLVERRIVDEAEVERFGAMSDSDCKLQVVDRAAHSHGVAHSLVRYLAEQGLDVDGPGGVKAALAV